MKCSLCNNEITGYDYIMLPAGKCVCMSCSKIINNGVSIRVGSSVGAEKVKNECDTSDANNEVTTGSIGNEVLRPVQIKKKLDEYVVGQEKAKKAISVAVYNHYKRVTFNNNDIKKSNILLVGPTGSGKTYLVETLAKIMNVPVACCTATSLTEAGYIGDDVESVVGQLFNICDRDIEKTQKGIIFIDEIDKLCSASSDTEKKVGGKGVQQALLRLLEGSKVSIPTGDILMKNGAKIEIDTSNILFICGGAFPDVEEIIDKRINKSTKTNMGFCDGDSGKAQDKITDNLLTYVTTDDLKKFGMIPEFLGRLPVIAPLEELTVETLKKILSEPKGCLLSQYQALMEYDGITLKVDDNAMETIAEMAKAKGTGARSLRAIMEDVMQDLMFELPGSDVEEVIITKEYIEKKNGPLIRQHTKGAVAG